MVVYYILDLCVLRHFRHDSLLAMKIIYTLLFLFLSSFVFGQEQFDSTIIRKSILNKAKKIPRYNPTFHTQYFRSKYDKVFKKADESELYELTNNSNPLVRRSALYCLLIRHSEKALDLLNKNSGDTTQYFFIIFGDLGSYQTFLDELLNWLMPLPNEFNKSYNLTALQKDMIITMQNRRQKERQNNYLLNH